VDVGIAGFNSAWSSGRDNEIGRLWLAGDWQSGNVAPMMDGSDITIALVHHPGNWLVEYENPSVWRAIENEFSVILHGHEHSSWATTVEHNTTIAAGACYEHSKKPTGYNFARVSVTERRGELWLRRYDSKSGTWIPDLVGGRNDSGTGTWRFSNTRLFRDPRRSWSRDEIERLVFCEPIVVFARGSRAEPRDGYTSRVVEVFDSYKVPFRVVDVSDDEVAAAVLDWNRDSFPQVYIGGAFVGGSDRLDELHHSNTLGERIRLALAG
jgi:monothiol glutaredoxin